MSFYDEIAGVASDVLKEFKQGSVQLRRDDPTTVTYDLAATVRGVSKQYIDGTLVVAGDLMVIYAVPPVVPETTDIVVIDGLDYVVKRVQQIPAAGTPAAFRLFVGR